MWGVGRASRELLTPGAVANALTLRELPSVFPMNPAHGINGSLWSIPFEFWCYVGVAALGLIGLARRPSVTAGLVVMLVFCYVWLMHIGWRPAEKSWAFCSAVPFCGREWRRFSFPGPCFHQWRRPSSVGGLGLGSTGGNCGWGPLAAVWTGRRHARAWIVSPLLPGVQRAVLLARIRQSHGFVLRGLPLRLSHSATVGSRVRNPVAAGAFRGVVALRMLAGSLSWHCVEKHFLRLKGRSSRVSRRVPLKGAARRLPARGGSCWRAGLKRPGCAAH